MTLESLKNDVTLLGSEEVIANHNLFVFSLNRALRRLYSDRTVLKTVKLATGEIHPVTYYKKITCINGEKLELPIVPGAYSMRIHGDCRYMISDGEATKVYSITSKNEAQMVKGFVSYGGKITFWGSFTFTIYDFATYDQIYSELVEDIPDQDPTRVFDLRSLYGDFMSFVSSPTDEYGNPLKVYKLQDGKLEIDSDYIGEIIITYRRLPIEVHILEENPTIDVADEYTHMLTLLVAHYYYYMSKADLSEDFLRQYEETLTRLNANTYPQLDAKYIDTNGWA